METWDAIRARRNVRVYEDRPIPPDALDRILDAGRRSPSSVNQQRWDFIVCTDRGQLQELTQVWRGAGHVGRSAATVALVAPVPEDEGTRESIHYDLGQTTMSMLLAAADLGIGSCHSSVGDRELASRILGLPSDRFCPWLLAFGFPADRPLTPIKRPKRRPLEEVVHLGRW